MLAIQLRVGEEDIENDSDRLLAPEPFEQAAVYSARPRMTPVLRRRRRETGLVDIDGDDVGIRRLSGGKAAQIPV